MPVGCPLVFASISNGTEVSIVVLETVHKIQVSLPRPSPSKGILVQLQGPSPPHLSLASLPILPQGPSQGRISKPKKAQPYGKIKVENTVDQEFRQRSCTRTCFSDLDGGEDRRGGPARQPHTLTTPVPQTLLTHRAKMSRPEQWGWGWAL